MIRPLFLFLLLFPLAGFSQSLLVNGGFEEENICAEYQVNCAPEGWLYTVPSFNYYYKDDALAHGGSHYVGLVAASSQKSFHRTFVRTRLVCGLRKGGVYRLQFYIKSGYSILDSIGVYFSSHDFLFEKRPYATIRPSLFLTDAVEKPRRGDTSWQRVTVDYVARGDESFLTIGNFARRDLRSSAGSPGRETVLTVLLDDISLLPQDPKEALCSDWKQRTGEIYSQDERHEHQEKKIAVYKVKPPAEVKNTPTKMLRIDTLVVPDILFATNSFQLDKKALILLDSFFRQRPAALLDSVVVEGHTDNVGTAAWNEQLSFNRATAVATYLGYFLDVKISARGLGSLKPVADNNAPGGRRRNRRVEIYLYLRH